MKRRPKKKTAKIRSYARRVAVFAILLSIVLLFTWTYIRSALLGVLIGVGRGEAGVLEEKVSGNAVFAGGSVVVSAPVPGTVKFLVEDKESVRMGQVIAHVIAQDAAAFTESLSFARSELARYEESTEGEFQTLVSRLQEVYERAVDLLFSVQRAYARGDVAGAGVVETQLVEAEREILGGRNRLLTIEDRRAKLASNIQNIILAEKASTVEILAPASGVFSSEVAGVDTRLEAGALAGKDASDLTALFREASTGRPTTVRDGETVRAGEPIGRVVFGQKVAFYLPVKTEEKSSLKVGRQVGVSLGNTVLSEEAVITSVSDGKPPGYSVIAGEIPIVPANLVMRAGAVSLVVVSRSGVIVPRSAVMEKDGKTGVLAVQRTYARFVPVEVLLSKGDRTVVRGISLGDEIVIRAMGFLEGKRVR